MSRPSSFRCVEKSFPLDVIHTFNNVKMNGWSCSLKHGPAHFTVLKKIFRLDGMKVFKNIRTDGWTVQLQTRRSFFHGVEEPFRLDVMQPFKIIQIYGWAAFPNILCHGPAHFAALKYQFVLMLCRLPTTLKWTAGRAPQTRSSSSHSVEKVFRLDGMKLFNNIQVNGWAVLPQARPDVVHGVEEIFCLDVTQLFENLQVYGWAALPNIPCHGPAHSAALKNSFVLMLCSLSTTFN